MNKYFLLPNGEIFEIAVFKHWSGDYAESLFMPPMERPHDFTGKDMTLNFVEGDGGLNPDSFHTVASFTIPRGIPEIQKEFFELA